MKYFIQKIKKHIRTLVQIVLVFGAAFLVLLYFLGYYDFSFLDRYKIFSDESTGSNKNPFVSIEMDPPGETETTKADTETTAPSVGNEIAAAPNNEAKNTSKIFRQEDLYDHLSTIRTVSKALSHGYTAVPGDGSYVYNADRTILAKMTFDFKLPTRYANRAREVIEEVVVTPGENGENTDALISDEKYVTLNYTRESRPAVELYMGYILLDNGEEFFLLDSNGTPLCRYDAERYTPAYTRDRENRPLFRREDNGVIHYFHLSEDGTSFVLSDYDPETDSRGLHFDYPAVYGKSDSTSVYVISEQVMDVDAAEGIYGEWFVDSYLSGNPETIEAAASLPLPSKTLFGYEVRGADGQVIGRLTSAKFDTAYAFVQNRAAVTTEEDRGSLFFINENGVRAFTNTQLYINEHNRYVTEYLLPPLTTGIESIGHYYYDHGLVRVRRQIIDYWNYEMRGKTRVVKDYDCLIRLDGTEVSLPAGYTLEGYSEGIAILSKDGFYGVYDVVGEWIAQPIYLSASPCMSGLCVLQLPDGRSGMIDRSGNIVLPFTYDSISQVSSGLIATYRSENGWSIYCMMDDPSAEAEDVQK